MVVALMDQTHLTDSHGSKRKTEYEAVKEKHTIVHDHILNGVDYVKIKTTPKANRNSKT